MLTKEHPLWKQFERILSYGDPAYLIDEGLTFLTAIHEDLTLGLLPVASEDERLMRLILTNVHARGDGTPMVNYELPGVNKAVLMRAIRRLMDLGRLDAADLSTREGPDYAPRHVTADGLDWLEGPKNRGSGGHVVNNHYHLAPFVQGDHATIANATHSPGAAVTAASGSASIQQRIRVCIGQAGMHDPSVAAAIQQVAEAIDASTKLDQKYRIEAQELLLAIAEQCARPVVDRQSPARSKGLAAGMRDVLSLAADVLQVWTACWPTIAPALGVAT